MPISPAKTEVINPIATNMMSNARVRLSIPRFESKRLWNGVSGMQIQTPNTPRRMTGLMRPP